MIKLPLGLKIAKWQIVAALILAILFLFAAKDMGFEILADRVFLTLIAEWFVFMGIFIFQNIFFIGSKD